MQPRKGMLDRTKSATVHALHSLHVVYEIVLADLNLAVLIPTAKLPNLIPRQIFQLYGIMTEFNLLFYSFIGYLNSLPKFHSHKYVHI